MATETYKKASARLLGELLTLGWTIAPGLKVPHATTPEGDKRVWFHAQAVYCDTVVPKRIRVGSGDGFSSAASRSMWIDVRGMTVSTFAKEVEKFSHT